MSDQQLLERIRQGFKNAFGTTPEEVYIGATPDQIPGWDSLGHAVLASSLEQVFNTTFDIDELMAMEDVASIVEVMKKKSFQG